MKKILTCLPPTIGLVCEVLIIFNLGIEIYKFIRKPKDDSSNSKSNDLWEDNWNHHRGAGVRSTDIEGY